jgi:hypothetical protein
MITIGRLIIIGEIRSRMGLAVSNDDQVPPIPALPPHATLTSKSTTRISAQLLSQALFATN